MAETRIDPRTNRPLGDHGTCRQAIEFALETDVGRDDPEAFLRSWREGNLDEWPEFYDWLNTPAGKDAA